MNLKKRFEQRNPIKAAVPPASEDGLYELSEIKRNVFLESLHDISSDDLAPRPEKKKRTVSELIGMGIRSVVLIISIMVFIYSAAMIVRAVIDKQRADDLYGDIAGNIFDADLSREGEHAVALSPAAKLPSPMPDYHTGLDDSAWELEDGDSGDAYNIKFQQMKANLTFLRNQNPDIFGYIHIEGTNISYPIVKGEDNDYYLDRSYKGDYLVVGSIFADYRSNRDMLMNRNTVFYGHNIDNITWGQMFNNVTKFFDETLFHNTLIEIYTFDGIYYYKPFSIHQTIATYQYFTMHFATDEEFVTFCETMHSRSRIKNDATFTPDDKIITLSTCTNVGNGRYALHAKLVKVEN